jgi:hypothetical protein
VEPEGRNKFVDVDSPLNPTPILAWSNALANVDKAALDSMVKEFYFFPEPGVFLSTQNVEAQKRYFYNWISYRDLFVYRVSSPSFATNPLRPAQWRTLLHSTCYRSGPTPAPASSSLTDAAKRRLEVADLIGECSEQFSVEVTEAHTIRAIWRGVVYPDADNIPDTIKREVLYDLYEAGFYLDLVYLNEAAKKPKNPGEDADDPWTFNRLVKKCFPPRYLLKYPADLQFANQGLSAPTLEERLPQLLGMKQLMQQWKGRPRPPELEVTKARESYTSLDIADLEKAVASYFTQTFFDYFGRAAIVPHRL